MKKKIPLTILEALQPVTDENLSLIHPIIDENALFHLVDNDSNSDFYFKVLKQESRSGQMHYLCERKPQSKENTQAIGDWLPIDGAVRIMKIWISLLQSYNKIQTIYDDPILKAYQDQFLKEVEILDEDADVAPFNLKQQLYLDDYLTEVQQKIDTLKDGKSEDDIRQLIELKEEAKTIQKDLTKLPKREVVKRLSKFWGKAQKIGLDVIKEIFVSVTSEIVNRLITGHFGERA